MAEIKSTMDIIMEKTKGLTMTKEEKAEYRQQELTGKVRGLIQKYLDDILNLDRFKDEMAALSGKQEDAVRKTIVEESIPHIRLGENNEKVLLILEETNGLDVSPIQDIERTFIDRIDAEKTKRERSLREKLKENGIMGSAVILNLAADPGWKQYMAGQDEAFRGEISSCLK
jgi:hypothetical protein